MELRSTKRGLTKSISRFRGGAGVRTIGSFRGALEPGFTERISNRWRFSGARVFKPIRLNFRRPENSFALALRPRPRRAQSAHYVFSPTIQLTFPFTPINNAFFENYSDAKFQWLLSEMNAPGERRAASSPGGEFLTSLRRFRDYREELRWVQGQPALTLLREVRLAGRLASGSRSRVDASGGTPRVATSGNTPAPFLFTILHATRRPTPTRKEVSIHSGAWPAGRVRLPRDGRPAETEKMLVLLRPIFAPGGAAWRWPPSHSSSHSSSHGFSQTVETANAVSLRQAFFTQLTLAESRSRPAAAEAGSFANPSLTFVVSKPFDAMRRDQSFSQPADMSYAKRESPQLQTVVNALHNLRPSQSEMKLPHAPQLPSIEQLTSQVRQQLERELRIEKERRGL
jgi:hypothetical protein